MAEETSGAVYPAAVTIREVGTRDGFQNESNVIPTDVKVELAEMLAASGLKRIELTSMTRPDVIPQLSDAERVLAVATFPADVQVSLLIPNVRGLERALPFREKFSAVNVFLTASESHNRKNVGRSVTESLAGLRPTIERARAEGLHCQASVGTSLGCPYDGVVPISTVLDLATELASFGATEIAFGDTTGMGNPVSVRELYSEARRKLPGVEVTAHFHNTRGQGLANVLAALEVGVQSFESSFGELGGCPFPPGAKGNIASEDLVSMLEEMGIDTGIDLSLLLAAAEAVQVALGRRLGSHTLAAGPIDWHRNGGTL